MAENPALVRHKKLTEQILWLQKEIQASTEGSVDVSETDFKYKQFVQNWNKNTRSYKSLSPGKNKRQDITSMLRVLSRSMKLAGGVDTALLMDAQNIDPRYNPKDPKSVYKFLVKELQRTEKYLGSRNMKDRGSLSGISGDGAGKLLKLGDLNDRYVRRFDPKVIKANQEIAKRAKADYLRSTDQNSPDYDPEGWRLELPEGHPDRTFRAYDNVGSRDVTVTGSQFPVSGSIRESLKVNNSTNQSSSLGIGNYKGTQPFDIDAGATPWTDRSVRGPKQADDETRALLIRDTGNARAVNRLSSAQLSRYRISGGFKSDKGIMLTGGGGRSQFIKKLTISD